MLIGFSCLSKRSTGPEAFRPLDGITSQVPWGNNGVPGEKPWENHGKTMKYGWKTMKTMGKLWENYEMVGVYEVYMIL